MNKTKIEWTDYTWNPITGCTKGCYYCYAKKMAIRLQGRSGYSKENPFYPKFHPNRLDEPLEMRKSAMVFTCSMGEFFGPEILESWREEVYKIMEKTPWHIYQILTKRRIIEPEERDNFPENMWIGTSIDGTSNYWKKPLQSLKNCKASRKFISFEPLLGQNLPDDLSGIDWAIIGAQTGKGVSSPNPIIVREIVNVLHRSGIPIFIKDNLRKYFKNSKDKWWSTREDFPEMICEEI